MEHRIALDHVAIGRQKSNNIVLAGKAVSRFHAEIRVAGDKFYIRDLGSTYGTYLNGSRLDCDGDGLAPLSDGDLVTFGVNAAAPDGECEFVFTAKDAHLGIAEPAEGDAEKSSGADDGRISCEVASDILVVSLSGAFRGPECEAMVDDIIARVRSAPHDVVVDLWRVTYLNSYSFGAFVKLGERLRILGLGLALASAGGHVRRLLGMVGLSDIFGSYPTVAVASEQLRARRHAAK
jgi:anti-anti-sigma factor